MRTRISWKDLVRAWDDDEQAETIRATIAAIVYLEKPHHMPTEHEDTDKNGTLLSVSRQTEPPTTETHKSAKWIL